MTMILWCLLSEQWNLINILNLCKTNITCNVTCYPRTWRHKTCHFTVLFQNRNVWNATLLVFRVHDVIRNFNLPYFFKPFWNATELVFCVHDVIFRVRDFHFPHIIFPYFLKKKIIFVTESIFYKFYYFPKFSFSAQNLFLLSILQHVIGSQSNHINTMLPNEMVLAPLQKLKIKY